MEIDLTNLLNGGGDAVSVDCSFDFSDFVYGVYNPIQNGVFVKGSVYEKAGIVYLDAKVSFEFFGVCDRCADDFKKEYSFDLLRILVQELANDSDSDDYIVVKNGTLDLDELIKEEIELFLPAKILCRDDCKGICPTCGKNLNYEKCTCKKQTDPRMAALLQLLDED